jgi:glycerophosphoryl diester phosphodiesterase
MPGPRSVMLHRTWVGDRAMRSPGPGAAVSQPQVIELIRDSDTGLLLELKAPELYPGIVSDVVATMAAKPDYEESAVASGQLVIQSFTVAAMKDHKTQAPAIPVGLLGTPPVANLPALATWADQVDPNHLTIDHGYVERVHRLGMDCLVWTVDWSPAMRRAIGLGVDGGDHEQA